MVARAYTAQTGSRETEEKVSSQPSEVAHAGATRPFPRLNGDQRTKEKTKVAWKRRRELSKAKQNLHFLIGDQLLFDAFNDRYKKYYTT